MIRIRLSLLLLVLITAPLAATEYHGFALARSDQQKVLYVSAVQAEEFARGDEVFEGLKPVDRLTGSLRELVAKKEGSADALSFEMGGWFQQPEQARAERDALVDYLQGLGYEVSTLTARRELVVTEPVKGPIYGEFGRGLTDKLTGEVVAPLNYEIKAFDGPIWVSRNLPPSNYTWSLWNRKTGELIEEQPKGVMRYEAFPDEPNRSHRVSIYPRPDVGASGNRAYLTIPPGGCLIVLRGFKYQERWLGAHIWEDTYRIYDGDLQVVKTGICYDSR